MNKQPLGSKITFSMLLWLDQLITIQFVVQSCINYIMCLAFFFPSEDVVRVKKERENQAAKMSHLSEALSAAQEESEARRKEIERLQEERRKVNAVNMVLTDKQTDKQTNKEMDM